MKRPHIVNLELEDIAATAPNVEKYIEELQKQLEHYKRTNANQMAIAEAAKKAANDIQLERDQLAAHCERLRGRLIYASETFEMLQEHTHPSIECDAIAASCLEPLGESTAASLAEHDATVIETLMDGANDNVIDGYDKCIRFMRGYLSDKAYKLRQKAKDK